MKLNVPRLILLDNALGSSFTLTTVSSARDSSLKLMSFAASSIFRTRRASRGQSVTIVAKFFYPVFLINEEFVYQMMKM